MSDRGFEVGFAQKLYNFFAGIPIFPLLSVRFFGVLCWDLSVKPNATIVSKKFYI